MCKAVADDVVKVELIGNNFITDYDTLNDRCRWTGSEDVFTKICLYPTGYDPTNVTQPKRCLTAKSDMDGGTQIEGNKRTY